MNSLRQLALQSQSEIEQRKNQLLTRKYGASNYNPTMNWQKQSASPLKTWSSLDERVYSNAYNYLQQGLDTTKQYQDYSKQLINQNTQQQAQASTNQAIIQKYLGNQLRASGLSTQGVSDLQQRGIKEQYQNYLDNNAMQLNEQDQALSKEYRGVMQDYQKAYQDYINTAKESATNELMQAFSQAQSQGTLDSSMYQQLINEYDDLANPNTVSDIQLMYQAEQDRQEWEQVKKAYEIDERKTFTYSLDNEQFTDFGKLANKTRSDEIEENKRKLQQLQQNNTNNVVVQLWTKGKRGTYLYRNGKLYEIKSKYAKGKSLMDMYVENVTNPNQKYMN